MLALQEFRSRARGLPDVLDFALTPEDGIVQTKSGGLMASWYFRGRDTQSATHAELASISSRLNAALCMLGEGWMLHCDAIRRQANTYPATGAFPDRTSLLIDEERRQQFLAEGAHFETFYALTLTYFPPEAAKRKVAAMMYEGGEGTNKAAQADRMLQQFRKTCEDFESVFSGLFPARRMRGIAGVDSFGRDYVVDEQLQYYEYCISGIDRPVRLPTIPMYQQQTTPQGLVNVEPSRAGGAVGRAVADVGQALGGTSRVAAQAVGQARADDDGMRMRVEEKRLADQDFQDKAWASRTFAEAQRFYLGPGQCDPCLEKLLEIIFVARATVLGDDLLLFKLYRPWTRHQFISDRRAPAPHRQPGDSLRMARSSADGARKGNPS